MKPALILSSLALAAEPFIEKTDRFTVGDDPAYQLYQIPGIVVTAKGTVLAWCEARNRAAGVSDWDEIRLSSSAARMKAKRGARRRASPMSRGRRRRTPSCSR